MRARRWVGALNQSETPSQVNRRKDARQAKAYRESGFDIMRRRLNDWVLSKPIQWFITAVICLNAITLGLETSSVVMRHLGGVIHWVDRIILAIFVIELSIKIFAQGTRFVRDGWNIFDFFLVLVQFATLVGTAASYFLGGAYQPFNFSYLRALRVVRVSATKLGVVVEDPALGPVTVTYRPPGLTMAFVIFGVGGAGLLVLLLVHRRRRR